MSGALSFHMGLAAEHRVAALYQDRGCYLLAERWRCAYGEIDLIFQDPKTGGLIFAEVKKSRSIAAAAARLTPAQIRLIYHAAQLFVPDQPLGQLTEMRFDAALVDVAGFVEIVENAFMDLA